MCPWKQLFFRCCGHTCWNDPEPCDFAQQFAAQTGDKTFRCAKSAGGSPEEAPEWHKCLQCGTTNILLTPVQDQVPSREAHRVPTAPMIPGIASFPQPNTSFTWVLDPAFNAPQPSDPQHYAKITPAASRESEPLPNSGVSLSNPTPRANFDPISQAIAFGFSAPMLEEQEDVFVARAIKDFGASHEKAKALFAAWKQKGVKGLLSKADK